MEGSNFPKVIYKHHIVCRMTSTVLSCFIFVVPLTLIFEENRLEAISMCPWRFSGFLLPSRYSGTLPQQKLLRSCAKMALVHAKRKLVILKKKRVGPSLNPSWDYFGHCPLQLPSLKWISPSARSSFSPSWSTSKLHESNCEAIKSLFYSPLTTRSIGICLRWSAWIWLCATS